MSDEHSAAKPRLAPGTRLNGIFEIDQRIASSSMGDIYRGHAIETGDPVAIDVMRTDLADNVTALALFRKEASALHYIRHEAIVRYYIFSHDPGTGRHYLAMEFVDGQPLSELLQRGPLGFEAVRLLQVRLAAGLNAVHQHGMIHRNVSPNNVLIPTGDLARAKIIGFGIARFGEDTVIGSYVAPEQLGLFGGDVTAKSDIYSLGLVLAQCLTGQPIDMGGTQVEVLEKRRVVPDLRAIDRRFRRLLEEMLQPNPADRPDSMADVAAWRPEPELPLPPQVESRSQTKVFISYRRDDNAGTAGRILDRLEPEFGRDLLFMDVDDIPLGFNFVKVLSDEVAKCGVLLAVIGRNWLDARDDEGKRRLENPSDFVRVEISVALQRDIPVIPILVDGAGIPSADRLPGDLKELALRHALEVRHASFKSDVDKLIRGLKRVTGGGERPDAHEGDRARPDKATDRRPEPGTAFKDIDVGPEMVIVPAGEFMMGSPSGEGDDKERPQHKVVIKNALAVGISPGRRGEFAAFIGETNHKIETGAHAWIDLEWKYDPGKSWRDPGFRQEDNHPVVCVNWHDAQAYVAWLRERSGRKAYRLLSESEWEYCCRAGTATAYSTGDTITTKQANFGRNANGTISVSKFSPNPWGLRHMHGNVWEWCEDNWHQDYNGNPPTNGTVWQGGDASLRVLRGGSWSSVPHILRSSFRYGDSPVARYDGVGFRVARTL